MAKIIMMRLQRWLEFSFGEWLGRVSEWMHRNKVAVDLADKLTHTGWRILKHKTVFDAPRDEVAIGI